MNKALLLKPKGKKYCFNEPVRYALGFSAAIETDLDE